MQYRSSYNSNFNRNQNPFNSLVSLLMFVGVLVLLFFLIKGFITILYLAAIPLIIITLILDYRIVADYVVSLFTTFKKDVLMGVVKVAFTALCYPVVIGWLFIKALFYRKLDKMNADISNQIKQFEKQDEGKFVDFEELDSKTENTKPQKPKIIEKPKLRITDRKNPYNDLFES